MNYDFRTSPLYRTAASSSSSSSSPMYGRSMYPRVGGQTQPHGGGASASPAPRPSPYHHPAPPPPPSSSSGLGIRVLMKPEYRITPPPNLAPLVGDIPRSNFQFDFDFEKKVLAEADKESPNWNKLAAEIAPARTSEPKPPPSSHTIMGDPVVGKYVASGLNREAVSVAVANYGDNPVKVREFAGGYNLLREMGFSSDSVAEALFMHENDKDKALAYLLNCSS